MKVKVMYSKKGEERILEGDYSYMESGDEERNPAFTISVSSDTAGDFDIKFNGTKEDLDGLINQLNILKYKGGNC